MFQIAASTRLILAMFQLAASLEEGFGKGLISLIQKYFPDQKIDINPSTVGHRLMSIVRKEVQGDPVRAMDIIQDWLTYMVDRDQDFSKDFDTWEDALKATYTNLRRRGISESQGHIRRRKKLKNVDDAYGKRGEDGGSPSGGEGAMPTPEGNELGKALDDQASVKEFLDVFNDHIDDLRASLSADARKLFDLIFEDNEGSFSSDIKANMNQATALKNKYPDLYEKNQKRWSGFVGGLRTQLLSEIWDYLDKHLSQGEYDVLKETFFGDVDPSFIRRKEKEKSQEREDYQQGIDERKLSRWMWEEKNSSLSDKDKKSFENLKKKLKDSGIDINSIPVEEEPVAKNWKIQKRKSTKAATIFNSLSIAIRVASISFKPSWRI